MKYPVAIELHTRPGVALHVPCLQVPVKILRNGYVARAALPPDHSLTPSSVASRHLCTTFAALCVLFQPTGQPDRLPSPCSSGRASSPTSRATLASGGHGDVGWVTVAIRTLGVDAVLAELKTACAAAPGEPQRAAMHAVVQGQAHHLRGLARCSSGPRGGPARP